MSEQVHLLVIGHPRGGTSILFNMLCAAWPEFGHAEGEAPATAELALPGSRISKRPADAHRRNSIVSAAQAHRKRLVAVQIIRDPRDVMVSRFLRGGYAVYPEYYRDRLDRKQPKLGYLPLYYALREWRYTHEPLVVVRYEELVREPLFQQRRIEQALGREATGLQFEFFHQMPNLPMRAGERNEALTHGFVGRWRNPEHRAKLRESFVGNAEMLAAVRELGYERDDAWTAVLTGDSE